MNTINKIELDLTFSGQAQATHLNAQWANYLEETLSEVINSFCDSLDYHGEVLTIDTLELDLGALDAATFSQKLMQFRNRLQSKLQQTIPQIERHFTDIASVAIKDFFFQTPSFAIEMEKKKKNNHANSVSEATNLLQTLIHFLIHGNLPWWQVAKNFDLETMISHLVEREKNAFFMALQQLAQQFPMTIKRLVQQLKKESIYLIFNGLNFSKERILEIKQLLENKKLRSQNKEIMSFFYKNQENEKAFFLDLLQFVLAKNINLATTTTIEVVEQFVLVQPKILENEGYTETKTSIVEAATMQQYNIEFSGMVLTAGFLPHFFTQLGLLNANGFVSDEAQQKAVLALHFLTTGNMAVAEYELTLEKVLCGLDPETFIPMDLELDKPKLEQEANDLLVSLIRYWEALKDTSVDVLRHTFLQRNGILERSEGNSWTLHVEHGAFDVLLQFLPAGIPLSTIIFSWSNSILYVSWNGD